MKRIAWQLGVFLEAIKFEHTVFALPFAYMGMLLGRMGWPTLRELGWVTAAMVGARTAGMALNRLIDLEIDRRNPRTAGRALPRGLLSLRFVWGVVAAALLLLVAAAAALNPLCFQLSPAAVILLFGYSYTKRFTWLSHVALGVVLACAPVGGWIAVTGRIDLPPLVLGVAVICWLAGFDIIYACLDEEFDRRHGLRSIPQRFGVVAALRLSALFHLGTFAALLAVASLLPLSPWYLVGCVIAGGLLVYEHCLVSPTDLSRVNTAFFTVNASLSVVLLVFTTLSVSLR